MEKLYKVLSEDGSAWYGGTGKWNLPHDGLPGEWMPPIEGALVACEAGYHVCTLRQLLIWLGPRIFEVETRGDLLPCTDKIVAREARLSRETAWDARCASLFTCDCAEHVLPYWERLYPTDKRPHGVIGVARRYARGEATRTELAAARMVAEEVAWEAWAAARTAWAAWEVSWAARRAEREWQAQRLLYYLGGGAGEGKGEGGLR